jgi:SPP1 family predicted phage head-tail adaptor
MALVAGRLRHRVTIESASEAQDAFGEPIMSWGTLATVSAEKLDLSGRELFQAQQVNAKVTTQFRVRHRSDVTAKMRLKHAGTYYDIESYADPTGLKEELVLLASRSAN